MGSIEVPSIIRSNTMRVMTAGAAPSANGSRTVGRVIGVSSPHESPEETFAHPSRSTGTTMRPPCPNGPILLRAIQTNNPFRQKRLRQFNLHVHRGGWALPTEIRACRWAKPLYADISEGPTPAILRSWSGDVARGSTDQRDGRIAPIPPDLCIA